jgi:hypothetical protein
MTLHLIKLCVGVDSVEELARWQASRVAALKKKRATIELVHVTRHTPKRAPELLDGGSLFWVIKGQIAARQKLLDIREVRGKDGSPRCGLVYDPRLIPTGHFRDGAISTPKMPRPTREHSSAARICPKLYARNWPSWDCCRTAQVS